MVFTINGVSYNKKTDSNGRAGLPINLLPKSYNAKVSFSAKGYVSSSKSVTVTVKNMPTSINADNLVYNYGENAKINAYLKDRSNKAINAKSLIINFNGKNYTKTTDNKGMVSLDINVTPGSYNARFSFSEKGFVSSSKVICVRVNMPTFIIANNLTYFYGENTTLNAYLKDYYNNLLFNKSLIINFNGKNYTKTTDNEGKISFNIDAKPGNYSAFISFSEEGYISSSKNIDVSVLNVVKPNINVNSGYYNISSLLVNFTSNVSEYTIYCSLDNGRTWQNAKGSISFNLTRGNWKIVYYSSYKGFDSDLSYCKFIIGDIRSPFVWASHNSGLYKNAFCLNLSALSSFDENPEIYYTVDGSNPFENGILYSGLLNITNTTSVKFYSKDNKGFISDIVTCNYIYANVANLDSGRGFDTIQEAIDDVMTIDGDTIKVSLDYNNYKENIILNKSINLVGDLNGKLRLKSKINSLPIIKILSGGSNSFIYGFYFEYSNWGIYLEGTDNVTLISNRFEHLFYPFTCTKDNNTLIANNTIMTPSYLYKSIGVNAIESLNLQIINNSIELASNHAIGIQLLNESCENISIVNNKLINYLNQGIGLFINSPLITVKDNNISNFDVGMHVASFSSLFVNNVFVNNKWGLYLMFSVNNTYVSNNIYNNSKIGVYLSDSLITAKDSFCLNRLCDNKYFDFFSDSNVSYCINNNWWGVNNPVVSSDIQNFKNIYNGTGHLVMDSWMVMSLSSSSYKVNNFSHVERAKIYVDLNHNNLGNLIQSKYLLNDIEVILESSINNVSKRNVSYLKNGICCFDWNLMDLFEFSNYINVHAFIDNDNITSVINKKLTLDIFLFSTAIDTSVNFFVNYTSAIDFNNSNWVTYSWSETGLYTGVINIIVNGKIHNSINITNKYYLLFKNKYSNRVFEAIKFLNNVFASMKEGVWSPNHYYRNFAECFNLDIHNYDLVHERFLLYLKLIYNLTDDEIIFINNYSGFFVDKVGMLVDYHGDLYSRINFDFYNFRLPSSFAFRSNNVYYTDIEDENNVSIGYEGMRSFAIVTGNMTADDLRFWLDKKIEYVPGMMKAAYGTFLSALLVIYEHDRVADNAASKFNVTWQRVTPVCVSLCNDYNCLYITGESDHRMGIEAYGNKRNVWKFHFATSFSFSLVEQLVGNNIWNTTKIGSVTLGLFEGYLNNETLEIFTNDSYVFIKKANDNTSLLFLDLETGVVRDVFRFSGLLGTMPCYHDNITDNGVNYGNNLQNESSKEYQDLKVIFSSCFMSSFFVGDVSSLGLGLFGGLSTGSLIASSLIVLPLIIILFPNECNWLWENFIYLLNPNYKSYPNITIYEGFDYNNQNLFNDKFTALELNDKSLDDYIKFKFNDIFYKNPRKNYDNYVYKNINNNNNLKQFKIKNSGGGGPDSNDTDTDWIRVGKHIRELYDEYKLAKAEGETLKFVKSHFLELFTLYLKFQTIDMVDFLVNLFLFELSKEDP